MKRGMWIAFVLTISATSARAQSEQAKKVFNDQLAATWNRTRPMLEETLRKRLAEIGGNVSGSVDIKSVEVRQLDLDSPPGLDAMNSSLVALRVPRGLWNIGLKFKVQFKTTIQKRIRVKWGRLNLSWKVINETVTHTTHVWVLLKNLQVGVRLLLDPSDPERPKVTKVVPSVNFQLWIDSPNVIVSVLTGFVRATAAMRIQDIIVTAILNRQFGDVMDGFPGPVHAVDGAAWNPSAATKDLEAAARKMRDIAMQDNDGQMPNDTIVDRRFEGTASETLRVPYKVWTLRGRKTRYRDYTRTWRTYTGASITTRQHDSAIYTGHWLAAQSMAYAVTRDPSYQEAAKRALKGIRRLLDVASSPDFTYRDKLDAIQRSPKSLDQNHQGRLVRYACRAEDRAGDGWSEGNNDPVSVKTIDGVKWLGIPHRISRDQYNGVTQGLTWAMECLDDPAAKADAADAARRIANYLLDNNWEADTPAGTLSVTYLGQFAHQLAILTMAKKADPAKFGPVLEQNGPLAELAWFNGWIDEGGQHYKYYRYDLTQSSLSSLLKFDQSSAARWAKYAYAEKVVWKAISRHRNPYFTAVASLANLAPANVSLQVEDSLQQWLERPRTANGMPCDFASEEMKTYLAGVKTEPYKPLFGFTIDVEGDVNETRVDPTYAADVIPIKYRCPRSYQWGQSPFDVRPDEPAGDRFPGTDFQIAYWTARYLKLTTK